MEQLLELRFWIQLSVSEMVPIILIQHWFISCLGTGRRQVFICISDDIVTWRIIALPYFCELGINVFGTRVIFTSIVYL